MRLFPGVQHDAAAAGADFKCEIAGQGPVVRIYTAALEPGEHTFAAWMHRPPHFTRKTASSCHLSMILSGLRRGDLFHDLEAKYRARETPFLLRARRRK